MYLSGAGLTKATFRFHFTQAQAQQVAIWRFVTIHQHKVGIETEEELRGAISAARVRRKVEMRQDFSVGLCGYASTRAPIHPPIQNALTP